MGKLMQDIRYALRQLRKAPGFTITAVLTLALGIGANTAIFSLVNSILLSRLPVKDPGGLVRLGDNNNCCIQGGFPQNDNYALFSYDAYKNLRDHAPEFEHLTAMQANHGMGNLTARRASGDITSHSSIEEFVSGNYFDLFGLTPFRGRFLNTSDDTDGAPMAAVMNYRTWQRDYASDPGVVGSTFLLNAQPVTVVGIAPETFYGDRLSEVGTDFYLPISAEPAVALITARNTASFNWLWVMGRIKPGVEMGPLQEKLSGLLRQSLAANVKDYQQTAAKQHLDRSHIVLTRAAGGFDNMQEQSHKGLELLLEISGLVLLIACANIANLVLVRGMGRRSETSLRVALGAARGRIIRQMMTESIVLACIGGLVGTVIAFGGSKLLLRIAYPDAAVMPGFMLHASPSPMVLLFAFSLSLLTGVLFGLAPAWTTSHAAPADALRGVNRTTGSSSLLQRSLVVLQAAISVVLLVGAGLLSKSLNTLEHQDFRLQTENRIVLNMLPAKAGYKTEQLEGLYNRIQDQFHALPGVERVGLANYTPLGGDNWGMSVYIQGKPQKALEDNGSTMDSINADFLDAVGQHVIRGRNLLPTDTGASPGVALVNQAFVKKFFKSGEEPLGQHMGTNDAKFSGDFEIVGVAEDSMYINPRDAKKAAPMFFLPLVQAGRKDKGMKIAMAAGVVVLQVKAITPGLEQQIRHTLANIDPNLTIDQYQTFTTQVAGQFNGERMLARLTTLFGALALLLAAIGLYGVTAYTVARRTSEIGIRMALGAERTGVVWMVLRGALLQALVGLAIGVPVALLCSRYIESMLYQTAARDYTVTLGAVLILTVAACIAGLVPAQRAASIDPARALRTE